MYQKERQKVYKKLNGHCAYCGREILIKDMQIDHIIPQLNFEWIFKNNIQDMIPEFLIHLTESDLHHIDNLNPACRVCNKWKSTYHLELFRSEIQDQVKRLQLRSSNYRIAKLYGLIEETEAKVKFYFETQPRNN
jgi:5-methylcytosine-specific restriction endonuclease McrA|nr:MAG TPA: RECOMBINATION ENDONUCLEASE VII [Caudoviricetes sp.]